MAIWILRAVFVIVAAGLAVALGFEELRSSQGAETETNSFAPWLYLLVVMTIALITVGVDMAIKRKRVDTISCVYFGILIGLLLTFAVRLAVTPLMPVNDDAFSGRFEVVVGITLCYACISFLLQTKDDFRFIIPYVEFSREVKGLKPYVLDTSVVIDGRIADVVETHVLDNQLIMPRFVLNELQNIADSNDRLRRSRGRRGLDVLNRLRANRDVDLRIYDRTFPEMSGQTVDMMLVILAKRLEGKLITGDYNLNKVARIHNVPVINLNDLANALKPAFLPGESLNVRVVKRGEEEGQGVGYLDDGTMVVVEGGRDSINQEVPITVTSVLQTSAGRMIFGRLDGAESR